MTSKYSSLTQAKLKELLRFDPETGHFSWKSGSSSTRNNGIAGSLNKQGYRQICINGKNYTSHRLAWLYIHGNFPSKEIDHINGDRSDNRITNLRDVSRRENQLNQKKPKNNSTGIVGVQLFKATNKWHAVITVNYRHIHLGFFDSKEDAREARKKAEIKYGFHENHGR